MKKINIMIIMLVVCMAASAQKSKKITILHTNDTHSCIYPLNVNLADKMLAGRGGFLRRISMLKEERKKTPDLLLFDSGDFSQGSPYYTFYKGDVEIELMNRMGYDASTIGNHEFDFGIENMARIFRKAKFPIICSNYDFTGTEMEGLTKRWIIIKRNGVKIGVFALDPEMDGLVDQNKFVGVKYIDPIAVANEMGDFLKNKKRCDLVICISHMGWDSLGMNDQIIIKGSRNIDLFLGGHSHTYMEEIQYAENLDGKLIPNDQNGKHGIFIGNITIDMKRK